MFTHTFSTNEYSEIHSTKRDNGGVLFLLLLWTLVNLQSDVLTTPVPMQVISKAATATDIPEAHFAGNFAQGLDGQ